ncbi:hypothetical protein SAMN05216410_3611 [Sanguibacter gelidistatuariae]|uniref:Uncharacterized protein n=1 Tax=Sanguibacter gelidistatuariae TaxID=1814289 RepID=A0A1G6WFF1_9MICO|nr:hypothetical protein [Sanguibacter gelidistatuariae]SDD63785.1 hypothetical protein SAMN05216410_3611 [Sanguibacter gelidistatuariae]
MREHRFEVVEQPWRTFVHVQLADPSDRALQVFLNESPHRRTLGLLDSVLTGHVPSATGGGDRMSFVADAEQAVITDRLADLLEPDEAAADVTVPTRELRDLVQALLDARAEYRRESASESPA